MTNKELRKLSRAQLLELLLTQSRALEETQAQLAAAQEELSSRNLSVQEAGNLAEAAMKLNDVFLSAQNAADQYLFNVKNQNSVVDQALGQAEKIISDAKAQAAALEAQTQEKCDAMTQKAQRDSQKYWDDVRAKLDKYMERHPELKRELLSQAAKRRL